MSLIVSPAPSLIVAEFTANIGQGAATYDLCTATGDALVEKISIYCTVAGVGLTSAAFQTNDTTPFVIMNATDGAVANLTIAKNIGITWTQAAPFLLRSAKKIQFTIAGTGSSGTLIVTVRYSPATNGASLA